MQCLYHAAAPAPRKTPARIARRARPTQWRRALKRQFAVPQQIPAGAPADWLEYCRCNNSRYPPARAWPVTFPRRKACYDQQFSHTVSSSPFQRTTRISLSRVYPVCSFYLCHSVRQANDICAGWPRPCSPKAAMLSLIAAPPPHIRAGRACLSARLRVCAPLDA